LARKFGEQFPLGIRGQKTAQACPFLVLQHGGGAVDVAGRRICAGGHTHTVAGPRLTLFEHVADRCGARRWRPRPFPPGGRLRATACGFPSSFSCVFNSFLDFRAANPVVSLAAPVARCSRSAPQLGPAVPPLASISTRLCRMENQQADVFKNHPSRRVRASARNWAPSTQRPIAARNNPRNI